MKRTFGQLRRHILERDLLAVRNDSRPSRERLLLDNVAHEQAVVVRRIDEGHHGGGVHGPRHRVRPIGLLAEKAGQREDSGAVVARLDVDERHTRRAAVLADGELALAVLDLRVLAAADIFERGHAGPDDLLDATRLRGIDLELALGDFLQTH